MQRGRDRQTERVKRRSRKEGMERQREREIDEDRYMGRQRK